jgi:hypothetical protein
MLSATGWTWTRDSLGRVRQRDCWRCLPEEPDVCISTHTAQALDNAPCGTRHAPRGAYLYVTLLEPTTEHSEAAPARALHSADKSALLPQIGLPSRSRRPTPEGSQHSFESRPGHRCGPYPAHYRTAFAFSLLLYPPSHRVLLRVAFPCGEATGLPRSAAVTVWVRSRLCADGRSAALPVDRSPYLDRLPFGPSVSASCACPW